jgi:hypothetical protein
MGVEMGRLMTLSVLVTMLLMHSSSAWGQALEGGDKTGLTTVPEHMLGAEAPGEGAMEKYKDRLREMEEDVVRLKEKIYKTKVRLNLLKERILANVVAEAWAVITHVDDMGSEWTLTEVLYHLDGKKLFYKNNRKGFLEKNPSIEVFRGNVVPGNHIMTVEMTYSGAGSLFTYLKGYKFKITSKYTFYASRGRIVKLEVIGYERGGPTYTLEEKPGIKFVADQLPFNKENIARLTSGKD